MQFFLSCLGCNAEPRRRATECRLCHQHTSTLNNEYSPRIIIDTAEPTGNAYPAINLLLTVVCQDRWYLSSWIFCVGNSFLLLNQNHKPLLIIWKHADGLTCFSLFLEQQQTMHNQCNWFIWQHFCVEKVIFFHSTFRSCSMLITKQSCEEGSKND